MSMLRVIIVGVMAARSAQAANIIPGDARRGEQLFQTQQCVQCHSFKGKGGTLAPDLGRRVDRDFTPSVMASLMWNHAPQMWTAMGKQGIVKPTMTPESRQNSRSEGRSSLGPGPALRATINPWAGFLCPFRST